MKYEITGWVKFTVADEDELKAKLADLESQGVQGLKILPKEFVDAEDVLE